MSHFFSSWSHHDSGHVDQISMASSFSIPHLWQNYEVFLNFRGEDTGYGFTDHLYHGLVDRGIIVFRDNDMLRFNEGMDQLFEAINASKISIPIISPNYASSLWCLKELLQILKCKKTSGQLVFPIFYKVKPSDVRNQSGDFGKKFRLCKRNHDLDAKLVQELENAFMEVASMKGWESDKIADGHEAELVEIFVRKIINELRKDVLLVPHFLVGVEDHVQEIMKTIDSIPSNDAKIINIHGVGGIGKTTLAKVLFNKLSAHFEDRSFIPDIREASFTYKGMESLQKKLISDILTYNLALEESFADEGTTMFEKMFRRKKPLLLLDDVDNIRQLNRLTTGNNLFGPGSLVIITSRNKDITVPSAVNLKYELNELNYGQSYELFCKHAFRRDTSCPKEFKSIARDIVSITRGLPLAIEVIASLLHGKSKDIWNATLEKLRKQPDSNVMNKLRLSYEALAYDEKEIFLDIACLSIGDEPMFASYMWESCGFFPKTGIQTLISLSLIKFENKNHLIMNGHLRDLGREIVRQENLQDVGERSRIWLEDEAMEVIEGKQGTERVQALSLKSPANGQAIHCRSEQFDHMKNLRFLRMEKVHLTGDFENHLANLRWLRWGKLIGSDYIDIMAINFNLKELVVLELYQTNITEHWNGWNHIKHLKVLKLQSCDEITTTPDFSVLKELEVLILNDCVMLEKIDPSIGKLSKKLKILDVCYCGQLQELPEEVGKMEKLEQLLIDETSIRAIPISEGYMTRLEVLSAWKCKELTYIPDSVGSLVKLQRLVLRQYKLLIKNPRTIGNLKLVIEFMLRGTTVKHLELHDNSWIPINYLPTSIPLLSKSQVLDLYGCKGLKSLPELPLDLLCLLVAGSSMAILPDISKLFERRNRAPNLESLKAEKKQSTRARGKYLAGKSEVIATHDRLKNLMECLLERMKSLGIKTSVIGGDVLQVNDVGNIFIPIFSESFVSNVECLSMLEHMVERRKKSSNSHILPIFFAVEPSDVSLLTPLFKETLSKLHMTFGDKLVNQWKEAMIEVAIIKGLSVPESCTSEELHQQANSVCQMILHKLKMSQLSMGNHLVGIDHHVDRILNVLDLEVNDVQAVWIWGQDGVGKTTLARAVYHQLYSGFEACCFVDEIDVRARHSDGGVQFLQAKMVSDLLNREMEVMENITEGTNLISERFCRMKVLIVLDDVTEDFHLQALAGHLYWFGSGSRIIITARQECFMEVTPPVHSYKISFDLSEEHEDTLVQLFSRHAFRKTDPIENFDSLSREFVKILDPCRGLPLSIEILGSFLHGKSVAEWSSELQRLQEENSQNYVDTEKIISMSYDSLNEGQKREFLDISCFPHGIDSQIASSLWREIEVLMLLSLVKIDDNKRIWMHRIVRDFGKKIVDNINGQRGKKAHKSFICILFKL